MDFNANKVPADRLLPDSWTVKQEFRTEKIQDGYVLTNAPDEKVPMVTDQEGIREVVKTPIHVVQAVIEEGAKESSFLVLCTDGTREVIPLSAFKKALAPDASTANPATIEAPAAPAEGVV